MVTFFAKTLNFLKDLCFPLTCCCCGEFVDTEGLCPNCWKQIKWISEPKCRICGLPFEIDCEGVCADCLSQKPYFDRAVSVFEYNDVSKKIVLKFKNGDTTYIAGLLASWMYRSAKDMFAKADIIIPVPIHFWKRLKRKYNQAELLARELSNISGVKYGPDLLKKSKGNETARRIEPQTKIKKFIRFFRNDRKHV
ncbi:MAG: double zinc ribbon domain-containing protein [Alphaproteobacteria bacterium]|nr:double zinc ribbon domain-containing protein [Alphaproteobacteria bacterium]